MFVETEKCIVMPFLLGHKLNIHVRFFLSKLILEEATKANDLMILKSINIIACVKSSSSLFIRHFFTLFRKFAKSQAISNHHTSSLSLSLVLYYN